jgi:hypothetical protein
MGQYLSFPGLLLGIYGLYRAFKRKEPTGWIEPGDERDEVDDEDSGDEDNDDEGDDEETSSPGKAAGKVGQSADDSDDDDDSDGDDDDDDDDDDGTRNIDKRRTRKIMLLHLEGVVMAAKLAIIN